MREAYQFGTVEIRPVERQLMIDGRPAAVGSRAFDVLLALVKRRDRVVTKNELLDLAWPGLVVEENNLQAQVSALRRLLGPQAIATIPGRGYRFAVAESHDAQAVPPSPQAIETPSSSTPARRTLPKLPAPIIGREDELAALARLLEEHRLITVVGAPGIGKTSVALAAAEERIGKLRDGAVWVELAPISDAALVPAAIAQALRIEAAAGADTRVALMGALKNLQVLLVIDNADHVLDPVAALVDTILSQAPGVAMLVTSRSALKLRHERVFRLGPLGVPEAGASLEEARTFGAIALLEARAQAHDPRFALTEENIALAIDICRHLDGIALAIELAAARLPLLGMRGLAERIDERFRLLAAGTRLVPTRQQTLLAALDWSHELLSPEEQKVFRRLGVFAGGFSLATATAVARDGSMDEWAAIDALGSLVDRSLVEVDGAVVPRYRLLESARAYALLKLEQAGDELRAAQRAHATAMLELFEKADQESWTAPESAWRATYGVELDNVRVALDWSTRHDPRIAIALLGAAHSLFAMHALEYELRLRCETLEPGEDLEIAPAVAARYWLARSECTRFVNLDRARVCAWKAVALYREAGDARGEFLALSAAPMSCPVDEARQLVAQMNALERPDWPARVRFWGKRAAAFVAIRDGRLPEVGALLEQSLELARACDSELMEDRTLVNLADYALATGDVRKAVDLGRQILARVSERRTYLWLVAQGNLANALLQAGEIAEAREVIARFNELSRAAQWDTFATYGPVFALLAACEGRVESAARLLGHADRVTGARGGQQQPNETRAHELALKRIDAKLGAAERMRLMAEGEHLDQEAVCALTLDPVTIAPSGSNPGSFERFGK